MDSQLKNISKRIGREEEVDAEAVEAALFIITNWTRKQMKEMNYPAILWPKLGSFNLIDKRAPEEVKKDLQEFKNNFKKNGK
jgi:hypothetical protein